MLKPFFTFLFFMNCGSCYSQDSLKITQIDSIVTTINNSKLPTQHDTLINDKLVKGLKLTTYLTMILNKGELLKYQNLVKTEDATQKQFTLISYTSNTFYYQNNKLIKVEEYSSAYGYKKAFDWYYLNDKIIYYTLQTKEGKERASFLLELAKTMLKTVVK